MGYPEVESPEVLALSRAVHKWEAPEPEPNPNSPAYKVDVYVGNDYDGGWEAAHPLVVELAAHHKDGVSAALAYLAEGSTSNAPALIRWMMADAFKGHFESDEEFCKDQFGDVLDDHFAGWPKRADVGFPDISFAEVIDWEEVAYKAVGGSYGDEGEQVFYSIDVASGVYIFDTSIPFSDYENDEE